MADILTLLDRIKTAIYGKDVRQSICEAIRCCYDDGKTGAVDATAREKCDQLQNNWERGTVGSSVRFNDLPHLKQIVIANLGSMMDNSVRVIDVYTECTDFGVTGCSGRVTIHNGLNAGSIFVGSAELVTTTGHRLRMHCIEGGSYGGDGIYSDWAWENPPMTVGVEYLTTEMQGSNPIYVRTLHFDRYTQSDSPMEGVISIDSEVPTFPTIVGFYPQVVEKSTATTNSRPNVVTYTNGVVTNAMSASGLPDIAVEIQTLINTAISYTIRTTITPAKLSVMNSDNISISVVVKYTR